MISLQQNVIEQSTRFVDFGDRKPSKGSLSQMKDRIPDNASLLEIYDLALHSTFHPFLLWGFANYPQFCEKEKRALQLLSVITSYFKGYSQNIEYAAITCIQAVINRLGKQVAAPLFKSLLERLCEYPAYEYAKALVSIFPYLTTETIQGYIQPKMFHFFKKIEPYQYAACEILVALPYNAVHFSTDVFVQLFQNKVFIDNYLVKFVQVSAKSFSPDYIGRVLPVQVIKTATDNPALREGAIKSLLSLMIYIQPKVFNVCIQVAFNWSSENENIALTVLSRSDEFVTPKTIDLIPKLRNLLLNLSQSSDFSVRSKIVYIIAHNPTVFLGANNGIDRIIYVITRDPNPDIRFTFVENADELFSHCKIQQLSDIFFTYFLQTFDDQNPKIWNKLACNIYGSMGQQKIFQLLTKYYDLFPKLTNWRVIQSYFSTFIAFPVDVIRTAWHKFTLLLNSVLPNYTVPLTKIAKEFYLKITELVDYEGKMIVVDMLTMNFANSPSFRMRILFCKIVEHIYFHPFNRQQSDYLWPTIYKMASDPIDEVRVALIPPLIKFHRFFRVTENTQFEQESSAAYMDIGKNFKPYIQDTWSSNWDLFNKPITPVKEVESSQSMILQRSGNIQLHSSMVVFNSLSEKSPLMTKPATSVSSNINSKEVFRSNSKFHIHSSLGTKGTNSFVVFRKNTQSNLAQPSLPFLLPHLDPNE